MENSLIFNKIYEKATIKGISINALERQAGLASGSTYKWNKVSPSVKNLSKVAKVLGCSISDLIE